MGLLAQQHGGHYTLHWPVYCSGLQIADVGPMVWWGTQRHDRLHVVFIDNIIYVLTAPSCPRRRRELSPDKTGTIFFSQGKAGLLHYYTMMGVFLFSDRPRTALAGDYWELCLATNPGPGIPQRWLHVDRQLSDSQKSERRNYTTSATLTSRERYFRKTRRVGFVGPSFGSSPPPPTHTST